MSLEQDIFNEHINGAVFQMGVDDGIWGLHDAMDAIVWPHVVIWCKASPPDGQGKGKYFFRFNLEKYPSSAPTAVPWDVDKNQVLERGKWPQWSVYVSNVFKWDWKNGAALYAPCDRSIFKDSSHQNWKDQHPVYWWGPNSTIATTYLRFLDSILNGNRRL